MWVTLCPRRDTHRHSVNELTDNSRWLICPNFGYNIDAFVEIANNRSGIYVIYTISWYAKNSNILGYRR